MFKETVEFNVSEELVDANVQRGRGGKEAYLYHRDTEPRRLSYRELLELVNRTGSGLKRIGVSFENRVMILDDDTPEVVACVLGAIKIGAIPFVANTMMTRDDYEYLVNDSRSHTAIVGADYVEKVEGILGVSKYLKNLVVIGKPETDQISYQEIIGEASTDLEAVRLPPDEVVLWQYSSGTTGRPKGVMHTQGGILHSTDTYFKQVLGLGERDVCFSVSRLYFGYGQGNSMWGPLRFGATTVLAGGKFSPEGVLKILERYGVTILFAAPTHYNKMLENRDILRRYSLTSLRMCVSAGEPLPPVIYRKWKDLTGLDILDGIGSTEAFHIFMSNRPENAQPGSSGTPVPGYEVRIIDGQFNDVRTGEMGRLLVKGGSMASGYWNRYLKTKETFIGEWLLTGDVYYKDDKGYYWYYSRSDDMIRSSGVWVSPIEVEKILMEHPAILEAAAVQGYNEDGLQKVKAIVVLRPGYAESPDLIEELRNHVKDKTASYKKPERIEFVKELPKTSTGKIQRYKFRESEEQRLMHIRNGQI
ncbi:MAG: benzoate-CoA ligase family protein [Thaumarchaeota archaeon]|nr:benzoate-CoA ligase family protein [Nitrososphaerota archaeon]MCL5317858.1 benzoate-CoA ligase family protein [Nitrososphaerota archaeon]